MYSIHTILMPLINIVTHSHTHVHTCMHKYSTCVCVCVCMHARGACMCVGVCMCVWVCVHLRACITHIHTVYSEKYLHILVLV